MTVRQAHIHVRGRVQGVNFRYFARQEATKLSIKGWVRNRLDGRVEAVFEGEENAVHMMLDWCRQGPPMARVEEVETTWAEASGAFTGFEIRRF